MIWKKALSANYCTVLWARYLITVSSLLMYPDLVTIGMMDNTNPSVMPYSRAVGNMYYGGQYKEQLLDVIRLSAEHCDCLQSFFILHSMGGGESGVGDSLYIELST